MDGLDVTGPMTVPRTGATQAYRTITKAGVTFTVGTHLLRLVFDANSSSGSVGNFDWIQIAAPSRRRSSRRAVAAAAATELARPAASVFATEPMAQKTSWLASA
jgi:hypothetical protein